MISKKYIGLLCLIGIFSLSVSCSRGAGQKYTGYKVYDPENPDGYINYWCNKNNAKKSIWVRHKANEFEPKAVPSEQECRERFNADHDLLSDSNAK